MFVLADCYIFVAFDGFDSWIDIAHAVSVRGLEPLKHHLTYFLTPEFKVIPLFERWISNYYPYPPSRGRLFQVLHGREGFISQYF